MHVAEAVFVACLCCADTACDRSPRVQYLPQTQPNAARTA
jgi:hypothetical protein